MTNSSKSATDLDRAIAARIRARRQASGITQEKLADALGITFQQVQKYEKGMNRVSAGRLIEIAGALGCTLHDLTGEADFETPFMTTPVARVAGAIMAYPEHQRGAVVAAVRGMLAAISADDRPRLVAAE
jgi:transcriptional regulator with XRE-family HTH domain